MDSQIQSTALFNIEALHYLVYKDEPLPKSEPSTISKLPPGYDTQSFSKRVAGMLMEILNPQNLIMDQDNQGNKSQITKSDYYKSLLLNFPLSGRYTRQFSPKGKDEEYERLIPLLEACLINLLKDPSHDISKKLFLYAGLAKMPKPYRINIEDINFIGVMLKHKKLRESILNINQIQDGILKEGNCDESEMQVYVNQLRSELMEQDVYLMEDLPVYAITTYRGKIYFRESLFIENKDSVVTEFTKNQTRVLRLITIVQEMFCHLKRVRFGVLEDVLNGTHEMMIHYDKPVNESGNYMGFEVFGSFVLRNEINQEYIDLFFNPETWEESKNIAVPYLVHSFKDQKCQQGQYRNSNDEDTPSMIDVLKPKVRHISPRCIHQHKGLSGWMLEAHEYQEKNGWKNQKNILFKD